MPENISRSLLQNGAQRIDRTITSIASVTSWLFAVLMLVILTNVVLRYVFDRPLSALAELQWRLYALAAMVGLAHALVTDSHVRVDLFYSRFPQLLKKAIETFSLVFLLVPLCVFLTVEGWKSFLPAWRLGEKSAQPGGLPFHWIVDGAIPAGALLLLVAAISRCIRLWCQPDKQD